MMTTGPDGPHEMIGSIGGASGPVGGLQAMLLEALLGGGMIAPDMDHFFRLQQGYVGQVLGGVRGLLACGTRPPCDRFGIG